MYLKKKTSIGMALSQYVLLLLNTLFFVFIEISKD